MLPDSILTASTTMAAQARHYAMGTVMTHKAFGLRAEESITAVIAEIARIETILSRFLPDSDISRVNRSAGLRSERISLEAYAVLSKAAAFSRACPGCFDVTIEPLVNLWQTARETASRPEAFDIQQVLPLVNYRDLILDPWEMTAELRNAGQSIDLGGIGKGFAGDSILEVYKAFGIPSAYSNLGGNVVTLGAKPDGSPWHIGIQHPRQENRLIGSVAVINQSVVTSGDYQRFYTDQQGKRCHHILNPTTGYPAEAGLLSVSIVSENSLAADALSTAMFVAGMEKGLEFLRSFPQTGAILVRSDLNVYVTSGLKHRFQADRDMNVTIVD